MNLDGRDFLRLGAVVLAVVAVSACSSTSGEILPVDFSVHQCPDFVLLDEGGVENPHCYSIQ